MEKLPAKPAKKEEDEEIKEEILGDEIDGMEDLEHEIEVEEKEFTIESKGSGNNDDDYFDMVAGHLQDVVFDPKFNAAQIKFFKENCMAFDETEENKMEYFDIFGKYKQMIELYIEKRLIEKIKGFKMSTFLKMLEKRAGQIDDQLADTLLSCTDFLLFKKLILEYKPKPKPECGILEISGTKVKFHAEEQSDGEEMPDIALDIKPYKEQNLFR